MVVTAILTGMLVQSAAVSGMAQFSYPDNTLFGLVSTSTAIGVGAFVITSVFLLRYRTGLQFTDETVSQLKQVTWPSREETLRASTTVVLTTFFTAFLLAAYDFLWKNLADLFLFTEG
jgi:preprotein translocase SecE subunit